MHGVFVFFGQAASAVIDLDYELYRSLDTADRDLSEIYRNWMT